MSDRVQSALLLIALALVIVGLSFLRPTPPTPEPGLNYPATPTYSGPVVNI